MKLLVLTEYWKVVDSQSGRQSHCVAETFLIALKNSVVSLGGIIVVVVYFSYHVVCWFVLIEFAPASSAVVFRPLG